MSDIDKLFKKAMTAAGRSKIQTRVYPSGSEEENFPTPIDKIPLLRSYPGFWGEKDQPSSKTNEHGVEQMFIDRGLQKELGLSRTTVGPRKDSKGYNFAWALHFYTHPGIRALVPVEPQILPYLADYLHALAVGVAPMNDLDRRINDWVAFHTFGLGGRFDTGKSALTYLKRRHFPFSAVEKNILPYGIRTF